MPSSVQMPPPKPPHAAEMECSGRPYAEYKACICATVGFMKMHSVCQPSLPPSIVSVQPSRPSALPPQAVPVQPSRPSALPPLLVSSQASTPPSSAPLVRQRQIPPPSVSAEHLPCRGLPTYSAYKACICATVGYWKEDHFCNSSVSAPAMEYMYHVRASALSPSITSVSPRPSPPQPAHPPQPLCQDAHTFYEYRACICTNVSDRMKAEAWCHFGDSSHLTGRET